MAYQSVVYTALDQDLSAKLLPLREIPGVVKSVSFNGGDVGMGTALQGVLANLVLVWLHSSYL